MYEEFMGTKPVAERLKVDLDALSAYMREHVDTDISAAHLVIDGGSVVLCNGDDLIDVLRHGQGVLNVLPMSGVRDEVDRQIISLRPEPLSSEQGRDEEGGTASVVAV